MDKNAIKKYAVWARRELIERVSQRAMIYGITAKDVGDSKEESVNGHLLSQAEKRQRQALIRNIKTKGYEQVMEEVAYTWFNRFAALRFMEVNGYLPSHIRVFTNDAGEFKPQILAEAIHLELEGLDMNKVYELESANKSEELFKYLLIVQCNALNSILPRMFQRIEDYTELLLPDYLLREGSVIEQMVTTIPEADWTDQVQIIGWLYQFYIAEPKDELINAHKQYKSKDIPFVTQLFTSDWIVHYMVENSLGRLWLEGHPNAALKSEWKYYLDEAEQEPEVQAQLATIRKKYAALKPEEIRVIDPCMGSGHILCVLFDVLVRIYEDYGYTAREAAVKIVENNLWGLDIDERAAQLSYFAVMMKARQYDRRFLTRGIVPHVYVINGSEEIKEENLKQMGATLSEEEKTRALTQARGLINDTIGAKEYGSLMSIAQYDWDLLSRFAIDDMHNEQLSLDLYGQEEACERFKQLIKVGRSLAQEYHVVVTNPPYMNSSYMPNKLKTFVQNAYPHFKNDTFSAFTQRVIKMTVEFGHIGLLMPYVWMFISSYEKMRSYVNSNVTISSMVQLEYNAFEAACVPVAALTMCKTPIHFSGEYIKLSEFRGAENQAPKTLAAVRDRNCGYRYTASQNAYSKIPGAPIAYWLSENIYKTYKFPKIGDISEPKKGFDTGNNEKYLRLWFEPLKHNICFIAQNAEEAQMYNVQWYPTTKGGPFRRWYGNNEYVVNWKNNGAELKAKKGANIRNERYYFGSGMAWSTLSSYKISFRYQPSGSLFECKGNKLFVNDPKDFYVVLAFLNSVVAQYYLTALSPTIDYNIGPLASVPAILPSDRQTRTTIDELVKRNISCSKLDWDSFETSWDFKKHPLVKGAKTIADAFYTWEQDCEERFQTLRQNEEEINRIFIDIYGLEKELTPKVEDKDVTVRKADRVREIKSFISYAVGCMFGRYSLDEDGLIYAGGEWDDCKYRTIIPDTDGILPICDDEYFEDDIVGRFVKFVEAVYGKETLEDNLQFIADTLGGNGSSRQIIRNYFINDFFTDHCSIYSVTGSGKRPIYWLFDSGKKNGFKCLIYMHRYQPDTLARIRTDYVHEQQSRYRTAIADLEQRINGASTSERVKMSKQLTMLQAQAEEIRVYEERIHHLADQMIKIDFDDGVKYNYEIFKDVLAKIK